MELPIDDMFSSGSDSPKPATTGRPSAPPPPVPSAVPDLKSDFADEMMREFSSKQSDLSFYSDDSQHVTSTGLADKSGSGVAPSSGYGFQSDMYGISQTKFGGADFDKNLEFEELEAKFAAQEKIGDVHTTGLSEMDTMFGLGGGIGGVSQMPKTETGAGDSRRDVFGIEEQTMGQFERVSPNMMGYGYDEAPSMTHKFQEDVLIPHSQEVPSEGMMSIGATTTTFSSRKVDYDDDDEDDFDRDSISQSQPSQQMSSKLSDSLEALKEIPREMPPPVQDHFAAPSSTTGRDFGRGDFDDDFEKDSISSHHPISTKLSDSLEVLKDSPQKESVRMDESLMDVDEFPSSKNSVKSISPNDVLADDLLGDSGLREHVSGDALSSGIGSSMQDTATVSESEQSGSPFENLSEEIKNMPSAQRDFYPDNTSEFNNTSGFISNTSNLPEITQSASYGLPDVSSTTSHHLPEVTSTSDPFMMKDPDYNTSSSFQDDSLDMFSTGHLPDVASSAPSKDYGRHSPEEDRPPPIPPHQNLTFDAPVSGSAMRNSAATDDLFSFTSMNESNIADVKNPFEYSHTEEFPVTMEDEKEVESALLSKKQELEQSSDFDGLMSQELPDMDPNQQSVTEDLEEFLPRDKDFGQEALKPIEEVKPPQPPKRDSPVFSSKSHDFDLLNQMESDDFTSSYTKPSQFSKQESPEPELVRKFNQPDTPEPELVHKFSQPETPEPEIIPKFSAPDVTKTLPPEPEPEFENFDDAEKSEPAFQNFQERSDPVFQHFVEPPQPSLEEFSQAETQQSIPEPEPVKPQPPTIKEKKESPKIVERHVEQPKPKKAIQRNEDEPIEISKETQQILNTFDPRCWFQPEKLHPKVSELVYWRDPKKSGAVFGSLFLVLIFLTFMSFISVVAYSSLAVLGGTLAFRVYKMVMQAVQKTNDGHPFKELLDAEVTVSDEKAQEVSAAVLQYFNSAAVKLRSLFLVEDLFDSLKFAAVLYVLTYIGAWFNGLTLVILGLIAMFAAPKVYETNKTVIDQYLELAQAKYSEIQSKVTAAIPFGKKDKAQ